MPEKTALMMLVPVLAVMLIAVTWIVLGRLLYQSQGMLVAGPIVIILSLSLLYGVSYVLDKIPWVIKRRFPTFYRKRLTRDIYLPSTAYAILNNPLHIWESEIPYNLESLRGYPLATWIESTSRRQLKAINQKKGTLTVIDPYVRAILLSRLEWRERPAKGMETGYKYRGKPLYCGDLLEESGSHLYTIVWNDRSNSWGVKDEHHASEEDDLSGPMTTSLPFFLKRWDGLLNVLG